MRESMMKNLCSRCSNSCGDNKCYVGWINCWGKEFEDKKQKEALDDISRKCEEILENVWKIDMQGNGYEVIDKSVFTGVFMEHIK